MSHGAWIAVAALVAVVALASLVGAVVLGVRVWRTRVWLDELGVGGKIAFWGALIYTVFPIDLLPDPIYLDDMGVLAGSAIYLTRLIHKRRQAASLDPVNRGTPGATRSSQQQPPPPPQRPGRRTTRNTSPAQVPNEH